jgi:hypothetical protein
MSEGIRNKENIDLQEVKSMDLTIEERVVVGIIITIRNEKIVIDKDLAKLYQVETKVFNQAVKRNLAKFEGFMFQLTDSEKNELVTICDRFHSLKHSTSNPYAFTEHGVLMAASILNSDVAIEVNRRLVKAFVYLRRHIFEHSDLKALKEQVKKIESEQENIKLNQTLDTKIQSTKLTQLSREVMRLSKVLDDFQESHIVLKKSDIIQGDSNESN